MKRKSKWLKAASLYTCLGLILSYVMFCQPVRGEEEGAAMENISELAKTNIIENTENSQSITESGSVVLEEYHLEFDLDLQDIEEEEDEEENTNYLQIESVHIVTGQKIQEGDSLFTLTNKSVESVRRHLESELTDAQIALEEAEKSYQVGVEEAVNTKNLSLLNGEYADQIYEISMQSAYKEIEAQNAGIAGLEENISQIQKELEDTWEDFDELREELEEAETELIHTDQEKALLKYIELRELYLTKEEKYETEQESRQSKREEIEDLEEKIEECRETIQDMIEQMERKGADANTEKQSSSLEGSLAEQLYEYSLDLLNSNIEEAEKTKTEAKKCLDDFEEFVGDGTIRAKEGGLVTAVTVEEEELLKTNISMVTYIREGTYHLAVTVAQEDIPYLAVDDLVEVVFQAYPQQTLSGEIIEIGSETENQEANIVSYPVTVSIDTNDLVLYGGMTADITFQVDEMKK